MGAFLIPDIRLALMFIAAHEVPVRWSGFATKTLKHKTKYLIKLIVTNRKTIYFLMCATILKYSYAYI